MHRNKYLTLRFWELRKHWLSPCNKRYGFPQDNIMLWFGNNLLSYQHFLELLYAVITDLGQFNNTKEKTHTHKESNILASGFWLLTSHFSLLASSFWLLASGFWLTTSSFWPSGLFTPFPLQKNLQ